MAPIQEATGHQHAAILGIGTYRPSRVIPNAEIVDRIDSSDEWIQQRSGIKQRRWATPEETVQLMSVAASRAALEHAGVDARQIDLVIVATVTHLLQTPAIATAIAYELGTDQAAAFDISAACAGFCHGVAMASDLVRGGSAGYALVIGVERLSDLTDIERPRHGVHLRRRRGRRRDRPERHPGHRPGGLGLRRRAVRPDPPEGGLARRGRHRREARLRRAPPPDHAGQPGVPLGVLHDGQDGPAGPRPRRRLDRRARRVRARTRPTCASSTRWRAP